MLNNLHLPNREGKEDALVTGLERSDIFRARLAAIVESTYEPVTSWRSLCWSSIAACVRETDEAIIAIRNDGVIADWNEAATRLFGYSAEEAVGRDIATIVPPSRVDEFTEIKDTLAAGGRIHQLETARLRKDGSLVDVSLSIAPIIDRDGAVSGYADITRDITSRKRMVEALRRSEEQFRQVVKGAPIGMYIAIDGIFRYFNPAALAMFGAESADEIVGRTLLERIHPDSSSAVIERIRLVREGKKAVPFLEERLLRLDGSVFDAEVSAIPVIFEGHVGAIVFVRDITEHKRAEVERRGLELQLRQAQKMDAVGRMAGAVAHDFNNMLMGVSAQTELLMKTLDPRQVEERARIILSAVETAAELTKKLLSFSRMEELTTSTFDLSHLVAETIEFIGRLLPKNISVDARLSASPCWVNADRVQMEQTLINLVLNARDAMLEGGKLVLSACQINADDLEPHEGVPGGTYAMISVADTGHGIPEQHLGKIFDPFFTTKPKERGTGLGLSIVYGIVTQSGGHIRVKSTVGAGTTFTIYIPSVERPTGGPPKLNPCPLEISEASCPQVSFPPSNH
jgi:PAS domain S-box-containing protein